jgi:L-alanine-DL-glutamate epimerase-like enolase superfamily enzyme
VLLRLNARAETWPLVAPFRISRGVKVDAHVIVAELSQDGALGRGESVPYARYGETVDSVLNQIRDVQDALTDCTSCRDLGALMPPGAARNAVDCALWDLTAKLGKRSVSDLLRTPPLGPMVSALTVSLDDPAAMFAAAAAISDAPLIKVKVDASQPDLQIRAVRRGAPRAKLIVDPNESWSLELLKDLQSLLKEARVDLIEQPLPAGTDELLEGFESECAICADESCHVASDLVQLGGRYQAINIKLDKAGGLTAAMELLNAARSRGFKVMVGCMICTSLGIAPALHVARHADFVDLDGPWWLREDRAAGIKFEAGILQPPGDNLWGEA